MMTKKLKQSLKMIASHCINQFSKGTTVIGVPQGSISGPCCFWSCYLHAKYSNARFVQIELKVSFKHICFGKMTFHVYFFLIY